MNTLMWEHPFTSKHLHVLQEELGIQVVPPREALLGCNTRGVGAMAQPTDILKVVVGAMTEPVQGNIKVTEPVAVQEEAEKKQTKKKRKRGQK